MIGSAIAQAKKYVNIILEPSVVNAESIQNDFYEAGEYLVNLDYSQTRGAENIDVIRLKQDYTAVGIKSSGAPRLNRDIIDAKKYVTIHLDGEEFERNNIDYMFQCGEYLVGEVDLSKIKRVRSMNKTFDGDVNVTDVVLNTRTVTDAKYAFRDTKIERLNMEEFNFASPSNFEGLITGVTTLKDITLNSMSGVIWDDVSKSIKNDIRVFKANDCNFIKTLDTSTWTACEEFELGSDQLTSLTLFTNRNALKSFVLKAPKANIGTSFEISSDNLEKFELEVKSLSTISVTSPKLKSIDLSKCNTIANFTFNTPLLQELDLSNTLITSLNIKDFANLKASGAMIDSKGWFAKNCKSLKTVLMRMDQVRVGPSDTPLQLDGCTALESVTVYSEDEGETGGVEYHYGTEHHYGKMFLNDKEITGGGADVLDTLESTSKTEALSANMGKTLNDSKLNINGSNGTAAGVSALINKLTEGGADPQDNDYYVSQYAGGGTSTTTYHRRPVKALWNYIKSKLSSVLKINDWTTFDTYRYVSTESPTTTCFWYKIGTWNPYIKDTLYYNTNDAYDDVLEFEIIGDPNYPYFGHYILRISKYNKTSVSLRLENLGTSGNAELAVAIDAQGNVYIQAYALWVSRSRVRVISGNGLYKTMSMTKVGYAGFGTANGFTALKIYKNNCASKFVISTSGVFSFSAEYTNQIFGNVNHATTADTATKATQDVNGKKLISFRFPNYSNNIKDVTSTETAWTATENCYVYGDVISANGGTNYPLRINGTQVRFYDDSGGIFISTFTGYVRKGDIIQGKYWKAYSLYD